VVHDTTDIRAFLLTDIEGSTRLWEQDPDRMRLALARHNALSRAAVEENDGTVVKLTGDGIHAVFEHPHDAIGAALQLQLALASSVAKDGIELRVRCGLHRGAVDRFDNDFFGSVVNRCARIMSAAHGGQILLSQAMAAAVGEQLPAVITLRDLGCARLRDLATPERLFQVVHPQLRQNFPSLRSLETTPNNLPEQLTPFIGRERDLVEITRLLANTRLLTLLGVGGIGKTRLSLQAAAEVIDDYPDGVWFVELAALADGQLVGPAVASTLGVREEGGRPVIEALVSHVKERRLLIVLDNCEHLLSACAELAKQLLRSGPHVKLLATSREALHVAGETTYNVPTLTVPDPRTSVPIDGLAQYEAVRLFVGRAAAARPKFELNHRNAAAVADICHRLDGIPLALELAAARVRALSVENIAERLSDRFRLLTKGDRTALPHQQTLRTSIDWSYELLSDPERLLLRRLSVFAGGWTLEAAETIAAGGELVQSHVLDLLTQLVEKSLVELDADSERYRMLETVREYAASRLEESGEDGQVRTQHLAFFVALAEQAGPALYGPAQVEWLARLAAERENLMAAHQRCDHAEGGVELGLRLVAPLSRYWIGRGPLEFGHRVTKEALERRGARRYGVAYCRALFVAGGVCFHLGRYDEQRRYMEDALSVARECGDRQSIAEALCRLSDMDIAGDLPTRQRQIEEALALARELGDTHLILTSLSSLAALHLDAGKLDVADSLLIENLSIAREAGDRESVAIALLNLMLLSLRRGSPGVGRQWLREAVAIALETSSKRLQDWALTAAVRLATAERDWTRAARLYGARTVHRQETGLGASEYSELDDVKLARETLGDAAFDAAAEVGRRLGSAKATEELQAWLEVVPKIS
jgi:predicted ATPase/class 3 adenylate cyclase